MAKQQKARSTHVVARLDNRLADLHSDFANLLIRSLGFEQAESLAHCMVQIALMTLRPAGCGQWLERGSRVGGAQ